MTPPKNDNGRIKLALAEMSVRERSMLEFFFSQKLDNQVQLTEQEMADVIVFDLDSLGALGHWEDFLAKKTGIGLGVSFSQPEVESDQSFWVSKPLRSKDFLVAMEGISNILNKGEVTSPEAVSIPDKPQPKIVNVATSEATPPLKKITHAPELNLSSERTDDAKEARAGKASSRVIMLKNQSSKEALGQSQPGDTSLPDRGRTLTAPNHPRIRGINILSLGVTEENLCGFREDTDLNDGGKCVALFYLRENYFQNSVDQAYRLSVNEQKPVLLSALGEKIAIFPNDNEICTTIREGSLVDICSVKLRPGQAETKILTGEEAHYYHIKRKITTSYVLQADAFVWLVALLSAHGRIPKGVNMESKVYLDRWPNLTRMAQTPNALRIAALWSATPTSLCETSKILNIPQRHVFAFFSAAFAIGHVKIQKSSAKLETKPVTKNSNGNLLSRLLHYLPTDGADAA